MPAQYAIGVDLGGTNVRVALVDREGKVLKKDKQPTNGPETLPMIQRMIDGIAPRKPIGVGIGVAGLVDSAEGRLIMAPNIKGLDGTRFAEHIQASTLKVENDANAAAYGELRFGAGKRFKSFVLLTLGTGIGCGVVREGRLMHIPAEAGHMTINFDGPRCDCGNNGCLELYASARAIVAAATRALEAGEQSGLRECCRGNIYRVSPEDIYKSAFDGDSLSREVMRNAGRALGVGIASLVNLLGPEAVVLMGGLTGAWDIYVEEAIREANRRTIKALASRTEIVRSELGSEDAGVIGAAAMALR